MLGKPVMHRPWWRLLSTFFITLGISGFLLTHIASANSERSVAGKVIVANGIVSADHKGLSRSLKRRTQIYVGDTISTQSNSVVHIRFIDGALIALRENSQFKIERYRIDDSDSANNRAWMSLLKGGFRTISGSIGHDQTEHYRVGTPVASIGIRGTNYEAVLVTPKQLVTAAWQGGIRLKNDAGVLDLGEGANFNFAQVRLDEPPRGLLTPPPALGTALPATRPEKTKTKNSPSSKNNLPGDAADKRPNAPDYSVRTDNTNPNSPLTNNDPQNGNDSAAANPQNQGDGRPERVFNDPLSGNNNDTPTDPTDPTDPVNPTDPVDPTDPVNPTDPVGPTDPVNPTDPVDPTDPVNPTDPVGPTDPVNPTDPVDPTDPSNPTTSPDSRLTDTEYSQLTRIGIIVTEINPCIPPNVCDEKLEGGMASIDTNGNAIITSNLNGPGDGGFLSLPATYVIRQGHATLSNFTTNTIGGVPVSWGLWNASASSPITIQKDSNDSSAIDSIEENSIFMVATPTSPNRLNGELKYQNVVDSLVISSNGNSQVLNSSFIVNVDTALISNGSMELLSTSATSSTIITNFDGHLIIDGIGAFLELNFTDINGATPLQQDSMGGFIVGNNGEGAVISFSIVDPPSGSGYTGTYLISQ